MEKDFNILDTVKENWVILVFFVSLVVSWTTFSIRLANAEAKIDNLTSIATQIQDIRINVAIIQTDVQYIKRQLQ